MSYSSKFTRKTNTATEYSQSSPTFNHGGPRSLSSSRFLILDILEDESIYYSDDKRENILGTLSYQEMENVNVFAH